ncbi:hypothetical protein IL306_003850 [Fusarium sp. DS 682]|nr:hypothetical protein IL306_003850 [Fusarium sp. DS 682]
MAHSTPTPNPSSGTPRDDAKGQGLSFDSQRPERQSILNSNSADVLFDALDYQSDIMIGASPMEKALLARQYQNMHDDRLKQDEEYGKAFCKHLESHKISLMYLIVLSLVPLKKNDGKWPPLYEGQTDVSFDFFLGFLEGPLTSWMEELSAIEITELYHLSSLMFKLYDPVHEAYNPSYEMIQEQVQSMLVRIGQKFRIRYFETD